ncbi:MAG: hypothetical protein HXX11_16670 [Desulfuromonadales bacterium]|nr:hypothetical protein [Desulfuromonadales bacterium]
MKCRYALILSITLFQLCSCASFDSGQPSSDRDMRSSKPLSMPVGKNWQLIEEAPNLSDEHGRLPFQTEQSVQPEGATKPVSPEDRRTIEMPH